MLDAQSGSAAVGYKKKTADLMDRNYRGVVTLNHHVFPITSLTFALSLSLFSSLRMQATLRRLKRTVLMQSVDVEHIANDLKGAGVPVTDASCRQCPDPCTEGHEPYPARFDVDFETRMLGSVKPYRRQIIISTGKSDWPREVTEESGSLAEHLQQTVQESPSQPATTSDTSTIHVNGLFKESEASRISILNGSHHTTSTSKDMETVLVFPDYTVLTDVPKSKNGSQLLYKASVDHSVPTGGLSVEGGLSTFVLPYSAVILLCSHKRRDNRCAIAAPKLEHRFCETLAHRGWTVDTQIDEHALEVSGSLDSAVDRAAHRSSLLRAAPSEKRALILKVSHIGGHKFAGNVNIYLPTGIGIWYGRVTTHEIEAIVEHTIEDGKILPALLRGGLNIAQPGCKSVHDW
ncbi:Sucrase/ferredoxin-like-domain-containing protein [Flagelloscypha sp. PMI_526]|nr:Sucrase/ferredoxin-like-domain-containing protein [Flagelloscypha sp. PMI_526]